MNNERSDAEGTVLVGRKPVLDALQHDAGRVDAVLLQQGARSGDHRQIMDACKRAGVRYQMVPKAKLDALHARHQGVAARLAAAAFVDEEAVFRAALDPATPLPLVLALDQVQDPGNVGALVRTLYGLGGAGIVLPRHNSAFLGPGAAKASAGTLARLPVAKVTNLARSLEQAEAMGLALYAAGMGPEAANAFAAPLELPAVLVLGNEDKGVRPGVAKRCRATLAVPLARDLESLNVAQAGALLLGCFARGQRM